MKERELIHIAGRIRALSQNGLLYSTNEYDTERYEELLDLSNQIVSLITDYPVSVIHDCFKLENDYVTPKVDVRAVVFNESNQILLVREKSDGCWSLPGGWADVGYSPGEVAVKEVWEETGLEVKPVRLLAVHDKKCHDHPPATHYAYKIFILCRVVGGEFNSVFDIQDKDYFSLDLLPPLSTERVLREQIELMFDYHMHPEKLAEID